MRGAYTDVGDEGMDEGEREPRRWVRRSCELRLDILRSRAGLARFVFEVIWRSSAAGVEDGSVAMAVDVESAAKKVNSRWW